MCNTERVNDNVEWMEAAEDRLVGISYCQIINFTMHFMIILTWISFSLIDWDVSGGEVVPCQVLITDDVVVDVVGDQS